MVKKKVEEDKFDKCLKHYILDGLFRNNIFAIMRKYKDTGCELNKILGTINMSTTCQHYLSIVIDLKKKFIVTNDPME